MRKTRREAGFFMGAIQARPHVRFDLRL